MFCPTAPALPPCQPPVAIDVHDLPRRAVVAALKQRSEVADALGERVKERVRPVARVPRVPATVRQVGRRGNSGQPLPRPAAVIALEHRQRFTRGTTRPVRTLDGRRLLEGRHQPAASRLGRLRIYDAVGAALQARLVVGQPIERPRSRSIEQQARPWRSCPTVARRSRRSRQPPPRRSAPPRASSAPSSRPSSPMPDPVAALIRVRGGRAMPGTTSRAGADSGR